MKGITNILNRYTKKRDNMVVILVVLISIIGISLNVDIVVTDELWNFQNVYKMYNGFELYKEANVIITPLFFYIANLLFHILGANFLTFRIYNIIINTILSFSTYVLCKKLKIPKKVSFIIVLSLLVMKNYNVILHMANYNVLALAFYIIGVGCLLKDKLTKKDFILQGIMTFTILFTKQNVGAIYFLAISIYILSEKIMIKNKIMNLIAVLLPICICGSFVIILFYYIGILNGFIDYTILGMMEFGQKNFNINALYFIGAIALNILNIFAINLMHQKGILTGKIYVNIKKVLIFSICSFFFIFPIINIAHCMYAIYLPVILLMFIINYICLHIFRYKYLEAIKYLLVIFVCIVISASLSSCISWNDNRITDKNSPYYGGIMKKEIEDKMEKIVQYIEDSDKNVIVLSEDAALYMVNLQRSNGKMDLPFKGNLGQDGEDGLIEALENLQNIEILIKKDESKIGWQESEKVREFIIDKYQYIGEIEDYIIYSN